MDLPSQKSGVNPGIRGLDPGFTTVMGLDLGFTVLRGLELGFTPDLRVLDLRVVLEVLEQVLLAQGTPASGRSAAQPAAGGGFGALCLNHCYVGHNARVAPHLLKH